MSKFYVVFCYADSASEWNCSEWRCLAPSNAINWSAEHNDEHKDLRAKLIHVSGFL